MDASEKFFPEPVDNLPDADITFKGIKGKLLQAENHQVVFMEIDAVGEIPPHSHGAQWGIVLKGEMSLTIEGNTKIYRKGDSYYIPADAVHSANFSAKVSAVDFFEDKDRYSVKK